ncbi:hypothetical protein OS493_035503 [Desmophyllum pertusum]|uniref:Uncharacterized protein n=1 Tax=Desmophyllum pertusum TaxID=174260 RepID=A0A9W9YII0_9CNID|nr:hypothetical protein OS493_035503 [Desmophyllum pertusum]
MNEKRKEQNATIDEQAAKLYEEMTQNYKHKGKHFNDVSSRQQRRHLLQIQKKTNDALWFAETYGLMPKSLVLRDDSGQLHTVEINGSSCSSSCTEAATGPENTVETSEGVNQDETENSTSKDKKCQTYESLPPEEQQKIKSIIYIMDKFSVSQEAYHELTQQDPALPRSYLVKACQQTLDDQWDVIRTPGECPGAELPFKLLLENELKKHLKNSVEEEPTVKVKVSGDGARMSHTSSLFVCSFSLSSAGNHTIAVVKGHKDYETLKNGLKNVREAVNQLIEQGYMIIDGKKVNLHFHLGDGMTRTFGPNWHKDPGCQHHPLFNIPPKDIVIDELHLMLRVTDRLEHGLILEIIDWDEGQFMVNLPQPTDQDIDDLQEKAKNWATLMESMAGSGPGYLHNTIITPYMHILIFHVPTMIRMHGSLKKFSGQGIVGEKSFY